MVAKGSNGRGIGRDIESNFTAKLESGVVEDTTRPGPIKSVAFRKLQCCAALRHFCRQDPAGDMDSESVGEPVLRRICAKLVHQIDRDAIGEEGRS